MADQRRDGRKTLEDVFAVARDPELEPEHKVLWFLYRSYESPTGKGAYPGDELLGEHLDRSPRTVRRYRRELLEAGYLEQRLRGPKPAAYRAVLPARDAAGEGEDSPDGPDPEPEDPDSWPAPSDLPENGAGHLEYPEGFEELWTAYPRTAGKKAAYRKVRARIIDGADLEGLLEAAERYAARMEREGREQQHVKHASTFFGPDDWWREELQRDDDRREGGRGVSRDALDAYDGGEP